MNDISSVGHSRSVKSATADGDASGRRHSDVASLAASSASERGKLFYLMGASGSGKDSILRWIGSRLDDNDRVMVAHRYLTRASDENEAGLTLSESEFKRRVHLGCYALHWCTHGVHYGVGIEIDAWREKGLNVLVNGSRGYLGDAFARYPDLHAIALSVDPEILATRLRQRGRETGSEVAARLVRGVQSFNMPRHCLMHEVRNDGALDEAAAAVLALVRNE